MMKSKILNILAVLTLSLILTSCDSKPRIIESQSASVEANDDSAPLFKDVSTASAPGTEEHKVLVEEVLNTEKYTYLNVTENDKKYWIAISKRDIAVGNTYYYKGGLLKRNFFSREFNRVFETVYLVSNIWEQPIGSGGGSALDAATARIKGGESIPNLEVGQIDPAEGAIKLSELFSNKEKYSGQMVKVTGKVVKVNPMIMNRNWLHIQDGSREGLDLTVTTTESVPLGAVVSLEGTIALDKDFGAGYRYDVIMEGAVVLR
jgi:hypothetical protein